MAKLKDFPEPMFSHLANLPCPAFDNHASCSFRAAMMDTVHHKGFSALSLTPQESFDVALSFVIEGLVKQETVCVVSPNAESKRLIATLKQRKYDAGDLKKAGRLHFNQGTDTPLEQAKYVTTVAGASKNRFRIFGDMTWTREKGWRMNDLHELEKMVDMSQTKGMLFLCQYNLDRFSGEEAMMALENHSHHLYRGVLKENPFKHRN